MSTVIKDTGTLVRSNTDLKRYSLTKIQYFFIAKVMNGSDTLFIPVGEFALQKNYSI